MIEGKYIDVEIGEVGHNQLMEIAADKIMHPGEIIGYAMNTLNELYQSMGDIDFDFYYRDGFEYMPMDIAKLKGSRQDGKKKKITLKCGNGVYEWTMRIAGDCDVSPSEVVNYGIGVLYKMHTTNKRLKAEGSKLEIFYIDGCEYEEVDVEIPFFDTEPEELFDDKKEGNNISAQD